MNSKILIIGSLPPPYHGVNIVNKMILDSELAKKFNFIHLDTSDQRSIRNLGRLDYRNTYLAIVHVLGLIKLLIKEKPGVVYLPICQTVTGYLRDAIFITISKIFRARIIIHLHGSYFRRLYETNNSVVKYFIRKSLSSVCKAIVLGKSLRYIFQDLILLDSITVVPNGVEDVSRSLHLPKIKIANNRLVVLYLSNLSKSKGYFDVIHAIPEVKKRVKDFKFIFAGESRLNESEHNIVREFLKDEKLEPYVEHRGLVTGADKTRLLLSSDIFVFPSHNEGQPLVILEAMAAGLPIITTDTGTTTEMVIDGENGFIVEKGNRNQITDRILRLINNKLLRKRMGRFSRSLFLERYTRDKFIGNLGMVFDEVMYYKPYE